jgi:hypothetical protein
MEIGDPINVVFSMATATGMTVMVNTPGPQVSAESQMEKVHFA